MKTVIYARVSSQQQDFERQIEELKRYAELNCFEVVGVYSEKISGSKIDREELERMINDIETKKIQIDKVLVWEFTRLGRSTINTLQNISRIKKAGVSIFTLKGGLDIDPKNPNPYSDMFIEILTSIATFEKEMIMQRLNSGLAKAKANGVHCSRPKGSFKPIEKTKGYDEIKRLLKQEKLNISQISKICKTTRNTVYKIKESL